MLGRFAAINQREPDNFPIFVFRHCQKSTSVGQLLYLVYLDSQGEISFMKFYEINSFGEWFVCLAKLPNLCQGSVQLERPTGLGAIPARS